MEEPESKSVVQRYFDFMGKGDEMFRLILKPFLSRLEGGRIEFVPDEFIAEGERVAVPPTPVPSRVAAPATTTSTCSSSVFRRGRSPTSPSTLTARSSRRRCSRAPADRRRRALMVRFGLWYEGIGNIAWVSALGQRSV